MKILLTNDDGIEAEGLRLLADWAKNLGEVSVFAPKFQQSGKSRSIEIHNSYEVAPSALFGDIEAYSVNSTPADCVRIAVLGMKKHFDLVISGINNGSNLGGDIHYSGTVAAAFEGAHLGIKSLAVSAVYNCLNHAVQNLDRAYNQIISRQMFKATDVINLNFPSDGNEILLTKVGPAIYSDDFAFSPEGMATPCLVCLYGGTANLAHDTDAVMTGHISITPLSLDLTDLKAFDFINKIV